MSKDLTHGSPIKLILLFALPMLMGNVFQQFYAMADTIVVGQYIGVQALAAVGATGGITFFVLGFMMGLSNGFSIIVAQRFGSKDEAGVRKAVGNIIVLSIIFGIIVTFLSVSGARFILELLNTPSDIIQYSFNYLTVIFGGLMATMAYNLIAAILRSLGDSKTPLIFLIVAAGLNVILDILFITQFGMHVEGTAYATIISQSISFICCLIYTKKRYPILHLSKDDFRLDHGLVRQLLRIAIPGAFANSITAFGVMVLQGTINQLGSDYVAAYTAGTKVDQFFTMPTMSLGMAMATFAGQNLGAGKLDRVKKGLKQTFVVSVGYSILGGVALVTFGEFFVKLFVSDASGVVLDASMQYLRIIAMFCWALAIVFLFRNTIQGLGNGTVPMITGFLELIMRVLVAIVLSKMIGFTGICLSNPIAWLAADVFLIPSYLKTMKNIQKQLGHA